MFDRMFRNRVSNQNQENEEHNPNELTLLNLIQQPQIKSQIENSIKQPLYSSEKRYSSNINYQVPYGSRAVQG